MEFALAKLILQEAYGPWRLTHEGVLRHLLVYNDRVAVANLDNVRRDDDLVMMPGSGPLKTQFTAWGHRQLMNQPKLESGWLSALMVQPVNGEYFERTSDPHLRDVTELKGRTTLYVNMEMFPGYVLVENLDGRGGALRFSLYVPGPSGMLLDWSEATGWLLERDIGGEQTALLIKELCALAFRQVAAPVGRAGFVIEQTCFELGLLESGQLCFGGDLLTPELTRYRDIETGKVVGQELEDWIWCLERLTGRSWPR